MKFKQQHAIYLQIADYIGERILSKEWQAHEKIPSIRDTATEVAVNPNTVARSYDYLETQGVIYTQRGLGYFVTATACEKIINLKHEKFLEEDLPLFFKTVELLQIDWAEIDQLYQKFIHNPQQPEEKIT